MVTSRERTRTLLQGPRSDLKLEGLICERREEKRGLHIANLPLKEVYSHSSRLITFTSTSFLGITFGLQKLQTKAELSLEKILHPELQVMRFFLLRSRSLFSELARIFENMLADERTQTR